MCWPCFNNGPSNGNTNQLTITGGNSINHANPVPVINLVVALNAKAATIKKTMNIASEIAAFASKLLIARNALIIFLEKV